MSLRVDSLNTCTHSISSIGATLSPYLPTLKNTEHYPPYPDGHYHPTYVYTQLQQMCVPDSCPDTLSKALLILHPKRKDVSEMKLETSCENEMHKVGIRSM